jgi:hypothetical protein
VIVGGGGTRRSAVIMGLPPDTGGEAARLDVGS